MRTILIFSILFSCFSCSKTTVEKTDEAIDVALSYLSARQCDDAIDVLEEVGRQTDNATYLQVLASAYACRGGVDEISFIGTDIPAINATSTNLLKSLSILSLSDEKDTDSNEYKDIRTALNILLETGSGSQPSQLNRTATFGTRKSGDMGLQILFLSIIQLGKFVNWYGNVNSVGAKGAGSNTNSCFISYSYPAAQTAVTAGGTSCTVYNDGHPDLSFSVNVDETKRRLCEGLVLLTNLIDVLENIDLTGVTSLSSLENVATLATQFKTNAITLDSNLGTLLNTTSQSMCKTTLDTASELNNMQLIYAAIFESGLP